jgi:hypothetical protein
LWAWQNLNLAVPMSYAEGLLSVAGTPEPFEQVAARWSPREETQPAPAEMIVATNPGTDPEEDDLSDLQPWEAIVVRQLRGVQEGMADQGYAAYERPRYNLLAPDSLDTALASLEPGEYRALAVCDGDCSDVDLMVTDEDGEVLGMDVLDDDYPIVDFKTSGGMTGVTVKMILCETDVCYYGLQLYRKNP